MVPLKPLAEPQAWQPQLSHVYSVTALQQGGAALLLSTHVQRAPWLGASLVF